MLYTKKGDDGTSGLYGTKERFSKGSRIYDALGVVDELNSLLGLCRARTKHAFPEFSTDIKCIQETLFIFQAELAGAPNAITTEHVHMLEDSIDHIECSIHNPRSFVMPGSTEHAALFDYARAVSRRAERDIIKVSTTHTISTEVFAYLNRLSSFLYALARYAATQENVREDTPSYKLTKTKYG